jgi:diphthine-ammonia ligase
VNFRITDADDMQLYSSRGGDAWSIHQCSFSGVIHSVCMIDYSEDVSELQRKLEQALKGLGSGLEARDFIHTSYLDVSIQGLWDVGNFSGRIPCRSIWEASGKKLAAVLILDTS